jgi:amino acid exporter
MQNIALYLPGILLSYAAFLLAIASPGPNVLAVIGTSMSAGRSSGMALAMGVSAGSFTWGVINAIGLTTIVASYASALFAIKILGGVYLLWLAYKSFKSAASRHDIDATELAGGHRTPLGYFARGYAVQMTNPKAALAWIAIISLGLKDGAPLWVGAAIVVGTFLLSIIIHTLYAVAFSTPTMVRIYARARRVIQGVLGAFFAFAGLRMLIGRS